MDTEEDTRSRPMAIESSFRSGLAKATIFLNEDAVGGPSVDCNAFGSILDNIDDFTTGVEVDEGLGS